MLSLVSSAVPDPILRQPRPAAAIRLAETRLRAAIPTVVRLAAGQRTLAAAIRRAPVAAIRRAPAGIRMLEVGLLRAVVQPPVARRTLVARSLEAWRTRAEITHRQAEAPRAAVLG